MDKSRIHRELHVPETEVRSRMAVRLRIVEDTLDNEQPLWVYYGLAPTASQTPVPTAGTEVTPTNHDYYSESNVTAAAPQPAVANSTVPGAVRAQVDWDQLQRADAARMAIGEAHQQIQEESRHEYLA